MTRRPNDPPERSGPIAPQNTPSGVDGVTPAAGEDAFHHLTLEGRLHASGCSLGEDAPPLVLATPAQASSDAQRAFRPGSSSIASDARLVRWQEELTHASQPRAAEQTAIHVPIAAREMGTVFTPPRAGRNIIWFWAALVGAALLLAYEFLPREKREVNAPVESAGVVPGADSFEPILSAPAFAPDCWRSDEGFRFRYKDASDHKQIVEEITEIPTLYRRNAECLPITGQEGTHAP